MEALVPRDEPQQLGAFFLPLVDSEESQWFMRAPRLLPPLFGWLIPKRSPPPPKQTTKIGAKEKWPRGEFNWEARWRR